MSAVAWTHWDEAFTAADKEPEKRLTFTLTPALFERALVSLAMEHGWLPKSDPRYQEACRTGRLEWWDGRGRCVVLVREGTRDSAGEWARGMTPAQAEAADRAAGFLRAPDPYAGQRWVNDPVTGHLIPESVAVAAAQFDKAAAEKIKEAEDKAIVEEQAKIDAAPLPIGPPRLPPGVDLGPPKTALTEPVKGKGKKK